MDDDNQAGAPRKRMVRKPPPPEIIMQGRTVVHTASEPRDIWNDRTQWPYVPTGYLYVPDVFDKVGRSLFGAEWTGEELTYRGNLLPFPKWREVFDGASNTIVNMDAYRAGKNAVSTLLGIDPDARFQMFTNEEWCRATDRWLHFDVNGPLIFRRQDGVVDYIHHQAESGGLRFYLRHEGKMYKVVTSAWNIDRPAVLQRIRLGWLNGVPAEWLSLLFDNKAIPFFAQESELDALLSGDVPPVHPEAVNPDQSTDAPTVARNMGGRKDTLPFTLAIYRERLANRSVLEAKKREANAIASVWRDPVPPPKGRRIETQLTPFHSRLRFVEGRLNHSSADEVITEVDRTLSELQR